MLLEIHPHIQLRNCQKAFIRWDFNLLFLKILRIWKNDNLGTTMNDFSFEFSDCSFENSGSWQQQPWNMGVRLHQNSSISPVLQGDLQFTSTVSSHVGLPPPSSASYTTPGTTLQHFPQIQNQPGTTPVFSRSPRPRGPDDSSSLSRACESYYLIDPEKGENIDVQSQDSLQSVVEFPVGSKEGNDWASGHSCGVPSIRNDRFVGDPSVPPLGGNQHPCTFICNSSNSLASQPSFEVHQERHSFLPSSKGVSAFSSSNVMTVAVPCKTRIRWTQDLHERFVECVNCLGGAEKATPKGILKLMDSEGLTIFHVKSHLQKYRMAKYIPDSAEGRSDRRPSTNGTAQLDAKTGMQITEALRLQLEVQRRLHEQLEIQRNLQLRIEEQGKKLKEMFDLQQKKATKTSPRMDYMFSDEQPTCFEHFPISSMREDSEISHFTPKTS